MRGWLAKLRCPFGWVCWNVGTSHHRFCSPYLYPSYRRAMSKTCLSTSRSQMAWSWCREKCSGICGGVHWNWARNSVTQSNPKSVDHIGGRLTTKWPWVWVVGVRMLPTPANFLLPWAFWLIYFEAVGNMLPSLGKLSRIENLLFRLRYSKKPFFPLPPPTLGSVAQTTHARKFCSSQVYCAQAWSTQKKFRGP